MKDVLDTLRGTGLAIEVLVKVVHDAVDGAASGQAWLDAPVHAISHRHEAVVRSDHD